MYSGQVKDVSKNNYGFFNITLVNDGTKYSVGKFAPKCKIGDVIEFEAEQNDRGFWNAITKTIKVVGKAQNTEVRAAPAAKVVAQSPGAAEYAIKEKYWKDKEARDIIEQARRHEGASRNTALEWVKLLVVNEAIKLGAANKREEVLNALLEDYTKKFMGIADNNDNNNTAVEKSDEEAAAEAGNSDNWD